jgi:hypothetical protein
MQAMQAPPSFTVIIIYRERESCQVFLTSHHIIKRCQVRPGQDLLSHFLSPYPPYLPPVPIAPETAAASLFALNALTLSTDFDNSAAILVTAAGICMFCRWWGRVGKGREG